MCLIVIPMLYVIVLNGLVKLMCIYISSFNFILLNVTNIFKVPEMAKKVVPAKKVPTIKKPEAPAAKGIHIIINIIIFCKVF